MQQIQIKIIWTVALAVIAGILIGLGSNAYLGFGTFFFLWALAGVIEIAS
jgi:hypothetical protein